MEELIRQKFRQNEKLRIKLLNDGCQNYYEMTTDKKWATGSRLPRDLGPVKVDEFAGENKVGAILSKIKKELVEELGRQSRVRKLSTQACQTGLDSEPDKNTDE